MQPKLSTTTLSHLRYYRLIPIGLLVYFVVALYPVLTGRAQEVFPFFSFKLYSKIPVGSTSIDLAGIDAAGDTTLLLYRNPSLSFLERKSFGARLASLARVQEDGVTADQLLAFRQNLPPEVTELVLVRYESDLLEAYASRQHPPLTVIKSVEF